MYCEIDEIEKKKEKKVLNFGEHKIGKNTFSNT